MTVASEGAAAVTGAGLVALAGALQSHKPALMDGVGLIVGMDRFMSEARAVTNFAGNAVGTVPFGTLTEEFDRDRAERAFAGELRFGETTLVDDGHGAPPEQPTAPGEEARARWLTHRHSLTFPGPAGWPPNHPAGPRLRGDATSTAVCVVKETWTKIRSRKTLVADP